MSYWKNFPNQETPLNDDNLNTETQKLKEMIEKLTAGWTELSDEITYSSWDVSVKTGIVNTSNDLTEMLNAGMKLSLKQNDETKYFFITKITSSQIHLFGGTDYVLTNEEISEIKYSTVKAPYGFPLDKQKWQLIKSLPSDESQSSPGAVVWYNLGGVYLDVPVGLWEIGYKVSAQNGHSGTSSKNRVITVTLSTANNSDSNPEFGLQTAVVGTYIRNTFEKSETKLIVSNTRWYLNTMSDTATGDIIYNLGAGKPTQIIADCAYL